MIFDLFKALECLKLRLCSFFFFVRLLKQIQGKEMKEEVKDEDSEMSELYSE